GLDGADAGSDLPGDDARVEDAGPALFFEVAGVDAAADDALDGLLALLRRGARAASRPRGEAAEASGRTPNTIAAAALTERAALGAGRHADALRLRDDVLGVAGHGSSRQDVRERAARAGQRPEQHLLDLRLRLLDGQPRVGVGALGRGARGGVVARRLGRRGGLGLRDLLDLFSLLDDLDLFLRL